MQRCQRSTHTQHPGPAAAAVLSSSAGLVPRRAAVHTQVLLLGSLAGPAACAWARTGPVAEGDNLLRDSLAEGNLLRDSLLRAVVGDNHTAGLVVAGHTPAAAADRARAVHTVVAGTGCLGRRVVVDSHLLVAVVGSHLPCQHRAWGSLVVEQPLS